MEGCEGQGKDTKVSGRGGKGWPGWVKKARGHKKGTGKAGRSSAGLGGRTGSEKESSGRC